jgi:hypothetical protein
LAALACLAVLPVLSPSAWAQESSSYVAGRITLSATAEQASSATYDTVVTFGQEGPTGTLSVCNNGVTQSAGFWSLYGDPPATIWLLVDHDPSNSSGVVLSWTGSSSLFGVYRSSQATTVLNPMSLAFSTASCSAADLPPNAPIIHYFVRQESP